MTMAGPLPHSMQIQANANLFLDEVRAEIDQASDILKRSSEFRSIYRTSLATHAVLTGLLNKSKGTSLCVVENIVKRIPLLVAARQLESARMMLRRFVELVAWEMYFYDHPVEWENFKSDPTKGFSKNIDNPIEYCAHRELSFYLNYSKARVADDPSTVASLAVSELIRLQSTLNADVHAGSSVKIVKHDVPLDNIDKDTLTVFYELQVSVFKYACILLAALHRLQFDALLPMYRAHFDWLVGKKLAKQIRSGPFGL